MDEAINVGWKGQPNGRGTFDILKSCGGTIILLCWSSVCPNVPCIGASRTERFFQKLSLFLLAILGPEFIFMTALGQYHAASKARKALAASKYGQEWTLRKAFFLNMGGVHLKPANWKSTRGKISFAINATQLIALVDSGVVDMPDIKESEISDRNKTDGPTRAITIIQVIWFVAGVMGRISAGLAVTTLEVTTLAFIFLMSATAVCWWRKPMDVSTPVVLEVDKNLATILLRLGSIADPLPRSYIGTPLGSIGREEWFLSRQWYYYTELLRKMRLVPHFQSHQELEYFPSIDFPQISLVLEVCIACPLILAYGAFFMTAWNFYFPSETERVLWHIAAVVCLTFIVLGELVAFLDQHGSWLWHGLMTNVVRRRRSEPSTNLAIEKTGPGGRQPSKSDHLPHCVEHYAELLRNVSPSKDPAMRIRLRTFLPCTSLCILYCFSRGYILVEDFASLRSLPESAFATANWSQYTPIL